MLPLLSSFLLSFNTVCDPNESRFILKLNYPSLTALIIPPNSQTKSYGNKDGFDYWTGVFTAQSQLWHLCKCESITGVKHVIYFGQWDVSDVAGVKGERWSHGWDGLLSPASPLWEIVLDNICCHFCLGSESSSPDLDAHLREDVDPPHWPN